MEELNQYLEEFQKEEYEILVYISKGWGAAGMYDDYKSVISYFPAMVDLRTGECIVADGRLETLVKTEDYNKDECFHFADNGIYRLLVSKCVHRDLGPEYLASMNNRFLLKKVIEENASSPDLEAIRAECTKDIIVEVCDTEFLLNRDLEWFEGKVNILGGTCSVFLCLDRNSKMKIKKASARFESLMQDMKDLDKKCKDFCSERMLDAANEWKENEDDPDITAESFMEKMGTPNEMVVHNNGKAEILYSDGGMFGGHGIQIRVNADNSIKDCELVG